MIVTRDDLSSDWICIWPDSAKLTMRDGRWHATAKSPCRIFYPHEHGLFKALFGVVPAPSSTERYKITKRLW